VLQPLNVNEVKIKASFGGCWTSSQEVVWQSIVLMMAPIKEANIGPMASTHAHTHTTRVTCVLTQFSEKTHKTNQHKSRIGAW